MKKLNLLLLLSILNGCNSHSQTKTFKSDRHDYHFKYPDGWIIESTSAHTDVIAPDDHPDEKGRESVEIISDETSDKSLEECYKVYVRDWYKEQVGASEIMAEGDHVIIGRKAKWVEYQLKRGDIFVTELIYLVYCGDRFFLITGRSSSKRYPSYKDKFEVVINSFTVEK